MNYSTFFQKFMNQITFVLAFIWIHCEGFSQGTNYWYVNGVPEYWTYQADIFAFKCANGASYAGTYNSAVVDSIVFKGDRRDSANQVYFNINSTSQERLLEIQNFLDYPDFAIPYPVITKIPNGIYTNELWYITTCLPFKRR